MSNAAQSNDSCKQSFDLNKDAEKQQKLERLRQFRELNRQTVLSGKLYCQSLKNIQETLQEKELLDNVKLFNPEYQEGEIVSAARDPLKGHQITREYRTKMVDWMIEVCVSFKFATRTYFLAVTILDKYLIAAHQNNMIIHNKEVHTLGVASMYLASKYEDVFPLHSKMVSEKIAHKAITQ